MPQHTTWSIPRAEQSATQAAALGALPYLAIDLQIARVALLRAVNVVEAHRVGEPQPGRYAPAPRIVGGNIRSFGRETPDQQTPGI